MTQVLEKEKKKIAQPRMTKHLKQEKFTALCLEDWINGYQFQDEEVEVAFTEYTEITNCTFTNMIFQGTFERANLLDVIFDHCDLSNVDFSERSIHRAIFRHCKLVGGTFHDGSLENVILEDCNLAYSNFTKTHIHDLLFQDCNLKEASLNEVAWTNLSFQNCSLMRAEFFKTSLKKIDFTSCQIEGVVLDLKHLKGLVVTSDQAILLSTLLGLTIVDEK